MKSGIGDIIGDKSKIRMILALYKNGPLKKTDLYTYVTKNSLNPHKLNEMQKDGLILQKYDRFANNMTVVELTDLGCKVAKKLQDVEDMMSGITPEPDNNFSASPEQRDTVNGR